VAASLTWEAVTAPLARFCRQPHLAPDKAAWGRTTPEQRVQEAERALRAQQAEHIANLAAVIQARDEHIAGLQQHARNLEEIRHDLGQHIANLEAERAAYQQTIFYKLYAQLREWRGRLGR
jgi:phage shock protein A